MSKPKTLATPRATSPVAARPAQAAPKKPAAPSGASYLVEGHALLLRRPLKEVQSQRAYVPLTVDMRHTVHPSLGPFTGGESTAILPAFAPGYLEQALARSPAHAEVPPAEMEIARFYPQVTQRKLAEMARAAKVDREDADDNALMLVGMIRLVYGLALTDTVPLIDAGLIPPPPNGRARLSVVTGPDGFTFRWGKGPATQLTVAEILNADQGGLLTASVIDVASEVHRWPLLDVCANVKQLEREGQAYMVDYLLEAPEDLDDAEEVLLGVMEEMLEEMRNISSPGALAAAIHERAWRSSDDCPLAEGPSVQLQISGFPLPSLSPLESPAMSPAHAPYAVYAWGPFGRYAAEVWVSRTAPETFDNGEPHPRDLHGHPLSQIWHVADREEGREQEEEGELEDRRESFRANDRWLSPILVVLLVKGTAKLIYDTAEAIDEDADAADERGGHARVSGLSYSFRFQTLITSPQAILDDLAGLAAGTHVVRVLQEYTRENAEELLTEMEWEYGRTIRTAYETLRASRTPVTIDQRDRTLEIAAGWGQCDLEKELTRTIRAEQANLTADPSLHRRRNPILSTDELSQLGNAYLQGADISGTSEGRAMARAQADRVHRSFADLQRKIRVEFTSRDPYASFGELQNDVTKNRHMWVYTGSSVTPLWDEKTNWMARAVHDHDHVLANTDFTPEGELATYQYSTNLVPALEPLYLSEIGLQAAASIINQGFPEGPQKLVMPTPETTRLASRYRRNPVPREQGRERPAVVIPVTPAEAWDAAGLLKRMRPEELATLYGAAGVPREKALLLVLAAEQIQAAAPGA